MQYIFPGADASTPLNWYILQLEQAGLEVESIENVGIHYSLTLNEWYNNWISNEATIAKVSVQRVAGHVADSCFVFLNPSMLAFHATLLRSSQTYPSSLCRLWRLFLAWSTIASRRGTATCWMICCHKVTDSFDRSKMIKNQGSSGKWTEASKFRVFR